LEQEIFKSHFFKLFSKYHVSSNYVFYKHLIITQIVHSYFADCLKENLKNSELEKSEKAGLMNYCFWISITIIMQSPFILQILCTRYLPKTTIPTFLYCLKFPYSDIFHSQNNSDYFKYIFIPWNYAIRSQSWIPRYGIQED
jgi:hypothetical protein